jgi:hypothetical protein
VSEPRRAAGAGIVRVDAAGTAVFAVTAVVEAVVLHRVTEVLGIAVALGLFAIGCAAFLLGYGRAIRRSRLDEINVGTLFLLIGPAVPVKTKRVLMSLLAAQVVVAVTTAATRPFTTLAFGVLVPVFGVGLNGLWAARHGRFPPRAVPERAAKSAARPGSRPPASRPAASRPPASRPPASRPPASRPPANGPPNPPTQRNRPAVPGGRGDPPARGPMEQNADHG